MSQCLSRRLAVAAAAAALLLSACSRPSDEPPATPASAPPASKVQLTVLVVGDQQLAEGVRLLRGEWSSRSGGSLQVENVSLDDRNNAEPPPADVVIFPSRLLGELAETNRLQPIRASVLDNREWGASDVFPAIRNGEMKYGGATLALPLGSPPLIACYKTLSRDAQSDWDVPGYPPRTWAEYHAAIAQWAQAAAGGPVATPLAGSAAAHALIARGVCYTESGRRHEALFDPEQMTPRIASPAFVKALAEIVDESAPRRDRAPVSYGEAADLVRAGEAVATLSWPGGAGDKPPSRASDAGRAVFAPLPTAETVYAASPGRWENQVRGEGVTVLGVEGRLVGVSRDTRNAVSAFRLAQWLTSGEAAIAISSRSDGTLWFRKSHAAAQRRWFERGGANQIRDDNLEAVAESLSVETPFIVPRVPGVDRYLSALADGVRKAAAGDATPEDALAATAAKWQSITDELGRDGQATAYRRHLGIDEFKVR